MSHPVQDRHGVCTAALLEDAGARRLRDECDGGTLLGALFDLVPAVRSFYGGCHPEFARRELGTVRAVAERAGIILSAAGMLWGTLGFSTVRFQSKKFKMLAGCAPGLDVVMGGFPS